MNCNNCKSAPATKPFGAFGLCDHCHVVMTSPAPIMIKCLNEKTDAETQSLIDQLRRAFNPKCECGNSKNPRGQGHSYWCKLYAKEFASTTR